MAEMGKEFFVGNGAEETSEGRTEAEVDAVAEAEVADVFAGEVEGVGIGEAAGVAIGGTDDDVDGIALAEALAGEEEVTTNNANDVVSGAVVAEGFVHEIRH